MESDNLEFRQDYRTRALSRHKLAVRVQREAGGQLWRVSYFSALDAAACKLRLRTTDPPLRSGSGGPPSVREWSAPIAAIVAGRQDKHLYPTLQSEDPDRSCRFFGAPADG